MSRLESLARSVHGAVLTPATPGYDDARQVFNIAAAGRPAVIVTCADPGDVQAALGYARDEQLSVAVRAGGHSIGGYGSAGGALMIDLRRLKEISYDGALGSVSVGGGCTWGDLLRALEPHAVAIPGGFDDRVGVAGLTLGGGYGLLSRARGLSCDNLVAAEVVTANGERVIASAEERPELLWGLRGAGANFGVVTRMGFRGHRLPPLVAGVAIYPMSRVRDLLPAVGDLMAGLPDAATVYVGLSTGNGTIELNGFYLGPLDDARRWLAPLAGLGGALHADFREVDYRALHAPNPVIFPEDHHHAWRADFVRALDAEILDAIAEHALLAAGAGMWLVIEHLGGAIGRVPADATAFPHRDAGFGIVSAVSWRPPGRPERALAIQARLQAALAPSSIGRYVNYVGVPHSDVDVAAAYGGNLSRLRELKRRWDPDNLFRHNVNLG